MITELRAMANLHFNESLALREAGDRSKAAGHKELSDVYQEAVKLAESGHLTEAEVIKRGTAAVGLSKDAWREVYVVITRKEKA